MQQTKTVEVTWVVERSYDGKTWTDFEGPYKERRNAESMCVSIPGGPGVRLVKVTTETTITREEE